VRNCLKSDGLTSGGEVPQGTLTCSMWAD